MPKFRVPYPPEFRRQMVELVRSGRTPEELAREFEPTAQSIWNWVRQAERDGGARKDGGVTSPERVFRFMSAHQAEFPIATMARVLGVSVSGYYAWRSRPASAHAATDATLLRRIRTIHAASHGTYGAPRVHAKLQAEGTAVARKRVARLMRVAGLRGVSRRRFPTTTQREPSHRPANDLVGRDFSAAGPNRLWVADITYVPTAAGFLFLAVLLDVWSRRIVGWAMATDLRTRLVLDALDMAVTTRKPADVVQHSDQGSQYTSVAFGFRCKEAGVRPSNGLVGDAYDNAMAEA
ncbi:IS3 family transposase, partial [Falsiroseomonas sp. HW251]|uniref:IS3 family transposase n=1 Tax=Falsiroseomonas sp. HW251 TaxID=3390998 RepID=UPI003D3167E2